MTETFGHAWTSSYGETPSDTWLAMLIDMTPEELRTGLIACANWTERFPPTLPQFRALCRPRREEAHQVFRRLPEPEEVRTQRREQGLAHLAGLREEGRYREWLAANAGRVEADFDMLLRSVRGMRLAACG
jgi:hypothetical protein